MEFFLWFGWTIDEHCIFYFHWYELVDRSSLIWAKYLNVPEVDPRGKVATLVDYYFSGNVTKSNLL